MNRKLVILPLLALLTGCLASCDKGDVIEDVEVEEEGPGLEEPEEFGGYRKVSRPVEGKQYIFGMLQSKVGKMIFMNGAPHRDYEDEYEQDPTKMIDYPFYFACNQYDYDPGDPTTYEGIDAGLNATKVRVVYDNPDDAESFRIAVIRGTGLEQYYDSKTTENDTFIEMYSDKNPDTGVHTSIKTVEALEEKTTWYFKYFEDYTYRGDTISVKGYGAVYKNIYQGDGVKPELVMLGTHSLYPNIEAVMIDRIAAGFKAQFWEKIE